MTQLERQNEALTRARIIGPRVFAWGSFGLTPHDHRGRHADLINIWTRIAPDGTITRHTTRAKARAGYRAKWSAELRAELDGSR